MSQPLDPDWHDETARSKPSSVDFSPHACESGGARKKSKAKKASLVTASGGFGQHFKLGVSLMDDGLFEAAIPEFQEAWECNPCHEKAFYMLIKALTGAGKPDQAIDLLNRKIEGDPRDKLARIKLAKVYETAGMTVNAIDEYKTMIEIEPRDLFARNRLGIMYLSEGQFDDAEREFEGILKLAPGDICTQASIIMVRRLRSAFEASLKPPTEKRARNLPTEVEEKAADLERITREFCDKYLDAEYGQLAEKLIEKMACEQDVPFMRGKTEIWAAAVIYVLGQCNDLFRKGSSPYATPDDICDYFGVKKSTVINKAAQIRKRFEMGRFGGEFSRDPLWKYIHPGSS